jgi:3-oxoacyl-[acyl-carrier protein] reductase
MKLIQRGLEGKVSLVTGASRGLGRAIAVALASEGSVVAVNYFQHDAAALDTIKEIEAAGGKAAIFKADIRDNSAVQAMVKNIIGCWGKIDILVNNAGIVRNGLLIRMTESKLG